MGRNNGVLAVVWGIIYIVIMLSLISVVNFITIHFIMLPVLILYRVLPPRWFTLTYVAVLGLLYFTGAAIGSLLAVISLFFLPPILVMGTLYKRERPARQAILFGTLTILVELIFLLFVAKLMGSDPIVTLQDALRSNLVTMDRYLQDNALTLGSVEDFIRYATRMLPLFMVIFSFYYVWITHSIGRWLLGRLGHPIPGLPPVRQWKLPKSLVWYYLIIIVLDLFLTAEADGYLLMAVWNIMPLLSIAFAVQAIGFLFYIVHEKKRSKALPIICIVVMIFIPPSQYLFSLLGVFDVMFPLRERFANKS